MTDSARLKYGMDVEILNQSQRSQKPSSRPCHPSLQAIARLLGKQAAAHVHKYRFEGLGRIELIRLQEEARLKSNNSDDESINSIDTS